MDSSSGGSHSPFSRFHVRLWSKDRTATKMSDQRPKRDTMSLEEATISNMWEIAAIVEVLERKGITLSLPKGK